MAKVQGKKAVSAARRVTGNDSQQQAEIAKAIKNAREMALLPYANRVTTQRGQRGDRGERGGRADGPPPRPTAPPPTGGGADDVSDNEETFETLETVGGEQE